MQFKYFTRHQGEHKYKKANDTTGFYELFYEYLDRTLWL